MIKIYLNGKENKIQKNQTINDLLDSQGLKENDCCSYQYENNS